MNESITHLRIEGLRDASWSPDGTAFVVASSNGVWVQDALQAHKPRRVTRDRDVFSIASNPSRSLLALGSQDLTVGVFDSITGSTQARFSVDAGMEILDLGFSPDGRWLASIGESSVLAADLLTGGVQRLPGGGGMIAWSGDSGILAYPTWENGGDGAIALWDRATGMVQRFLEVDKIALEAVACSPTVPLLIGGFTDGSVRVWDTTTGAEQTVLRQEDWVTDADFSPDGSLLAVHGESGTTRLWDMRTGQQCAAVQTAPGFRVLFSPTGSRLAIVGGGRIDVWAVPIQR